MTHFTTPDFWRLHNALPPEVRALADKNYLQLKADPIHPSLQFKNIFWIGPHAEYDKFLS